MTDTRITDTETLEAHYGEPSELARIKAIKKLDKHCRNFIAQSPFLVIGSSSADGADVSPKGDAPGFVTVLDDSTLLIPDRLGNNRVDTMRNIIDNPDVAMIFFVPGMNETLRVNGKAEIVTDPALLEPLSVRGKAPKSGILIHVDEAFLHCAKALVRSKLWDPSIQIDRKTFPPLGKMIVEQAGQGDAEDAENKVQESLKTRLY